jgi:hypothetical protein
VTKCWNRYGLLSALAFACLMSAIVPALAQDAAKSIIEKWRPKDGMYDLDNGGAFFVPCEKYPQHYVELGKREIAANEVYKCKVTRVTDAAPGVLRLNANCDDVNDGKTKDVITLRRIDDKSFFMSWTKDQGSRFIYCRESDDSGAK